MSEWAFKCFGQLLAIQFMFVNKIRGERSNQNSTNKMLFAPWCKSGKWHLQHVVNNKINIYGILKVDHGNKSGPMMRKTDPNKFNNVKYVLNKTETSKPQKRMVCVTLCKTQQYRTKTEN